MFGDDFFGGGIDDLFRKLAGEGFVESTVVGPDGKKRTTRRSTKDVLGRSLLDKVATKKNIYFIFDYSGKEDVYAEIKDELVVNDYGEKVSTGEKILQIKSGNNVLSEHQLSDKIRTKNFASEFKNGILEVSFRK